MLASTSLSIVLPAYREAESLDMLLPSLKARAAELSPDYEIVVVDAQTPVDETVHVCRLHGVRHVYRTHGGSYGDAVRTGIGTATGEFVMFMDADGSHNPDSIAGLWRLRQDYDVVIGSRYVDGGRTENPAILIFMSWVVNVVFRVCFGLACRDVTNSFRLYRGSRLRALSLRSDNFDIIEEILIKLCGNRANPIRLIEVPIVFEKRKAGESKRNLVVFAATYLSTLARLLYIRFREEGA